MPQRKALEYKTQHHPTISNTLCRMLHPHKQNKTTNQISSSRIPTSFGLAQERKNKQTKKYSAQISPYMKITQTTGPTLGGQTKRKKELNLEAWEKQTSNTIS